MTQPLIQSSSSSPVFHTIRLVHGSPPILTRISSQKTIRRLPKIKEKKNWSSFKKKCINITNSSATYAHTWCYGAKNNEKREENGRVSAIIKMHSHSQSTTSTSNLKQKKFIHFRFGCSMSIRENFWSLRSKARRRNSRSASNYEFRLHRQHTNTLSQATNCLKKLQIIKRNWSRAFFLWVFELWNVRECDESVWYVSCILLRESISWKNVLSA